MKLGEIAHFAQGDYWIIPKYYEFINHHRNVEKEREALVQIMTRPPRVRTQTFSASGAGYCLRKRQFDFLGRKKASFGEKTMNIFANGDYVHLRHQVAGIIMGYLKSAEVSVSRPDLRLTGTMDGLCSDDTGAEFKSINSRGFAQVLAYGVKADHREQITSYMVASGLTTFRVVYENKDTNELKEFVQERDPLLEEKVLGDLALLNQATDEERLIPMLEECVEGRGRFKGCPYKEICPLAQYTSSEPRRRRIQVVSSTPRPSSE